MSHTYLSYTREDATFADLLAGDLRDAGSEIWRDTERIDDGQDWAKAIEEARDAADVFVLLLSPAAAASEWVREDIAHAGRRGTPLLVARIADCDPPEELAGAAMVDFAKVRAATGVEQIGLYRPALNELIARLEELQPGKVARRGLQDPDDTVREEAARLLGDLGDGTAGSALIETLGDDDVDVRLAAAEALGKLRCEAAVRALVRRLDDEDADVAAAAAVALGAIGDGFAVEPLVDRLDHEDRFVRGEVALALGKLGATGAVPVLVKLMRNDPISDVREAATRALCTIRGPNAERALRRSGIDCEKLLADG